MEHFCCENYSQINQSWPRKSPANDIGGDGDSGHVLTQEVDDVAEMFSGVLASHVAQHRVAAALDWHVQELVDARVPHDFGDFIKMVQYVRGVGHSESQPTMLRNNLDEFTKQVGQGHPNVSGKLIEGVANIRSEVSWKVSLTQKKGSEGERP